MNNEMLKKWESAAWALEPPIDGLLFPFAVLTGEAIDVARFCQRNWKSTTIPRGEGTITRPGLESAVGNGTFTANIAQEIIEIEDALQAAQTQYRLLVNGPLAAPMDRATYVLGEMRQTLEWLFDDGKLDEADVQLEALNTEHDGAASQDAVAAALFDYAELSERHKEKMAGLGGFDVALIDEARALGTELREISAGPAEIDPPGADAQALDLRNRLGMMLYDRMQRVRAAARFVFRHDPDLVRDVTSAYARRQRTTLRGQNGSPSPQTPPAVPSPVAQPAAPPAVSAGK